MARMPRRSRGRQRVEMVRMPNETNRQVTFSKRRAGLFKKASEICTLCGVDVAIVVFSPGNKVFSFGHPSVEAVVERYLGNENNPPVEEDGGGAVATEQLIQAHRNARAQELCMELTHLESVMEGQKTKGEAIDVFAVANVEAQGWMRASEGEHSLQQLVTLRNGLENIMTQVHQNGHQLMMTHGNGYPMNPFAGGAFPPGNMAAGASTSAFNFGTGGGGGDTGGAAGALPFTGGGAAASGFPDNGSARDAGTSGASTSGGNLGFGPGF